MSGRTSLTGISTGPAAYGARNTSADSIPLPSGSIIPVPALKPFNLTQALLDGLTVLGGLIALVAVFGSLPLAVGLMIFGAF